MPLRTGQPVRTVLLVRPVSLVPPAPVRRAARNGIRSAWAQFLGVSTAGARAAAGPAARIPSPPATPAPAAPPATGIQPGSPARNRRDVATRRL